MSRTQEQRKADTRAGLLRAAADQFARKGFHAVSTEAIADSADRTTGALYAHFGSKEGLLLAVVDDYRDDTAEAIMAGVTGLADLDGIIGAAWEHMTAASDDGDSPWLLLEMELWLHGARDDAIREQLARRYDHVRRAIAQGIASRTADDATTRTALSPDEAATRALALLLGAALLHRLDPSAISAEGVIASVRRLVTEPDPDH